MLAHVLYCVAWCRVVTMCVAARCSKWLGCAGSGVVWIGVSWHGMAVPCIISRYLVVSGITNLSSRVVDFLAMVWY